MSTTTTLPSGQTLGTDIRVRFEAIESRLSELETAVTECATSTMLLANSVAKMSNQEEPFEAVDTASQ